MPPPKPSPHSHPSSGWLGWLKLDVRTDERRLLWRLFALHFCLLSFQYVAKSVRQATFVDSLGAAQLPWVYLLAALCSYPLLRLYTRSPESFGPRRLLLGSSLGVAAGLVFFWWALGLDSQWPSLLFYLWIAIVGLLLVSQLWCWAGLLLDPRQARRLFGAIGAGGILGGIVGGQMARWTSALLDTRSALWVAIAWLLAAAACAWSIRQPEKRPTTPPAQPSSDSLAEARSGLALLRHSSYLRLLAGLVLLATMVAQVIDLQLSWVIETSTSNLDQRTAAFGNLYSLTGIAALLCQLLLTGLMHRRHGVRLALYVLPLSNGLGTIFLICAALVAPTLVLPAVWWLKISENGLRYSLDQATRELLFMPLPEAGRARAKAFIDVFVQRFAKGAAAVALLAVTFGWLSIEATAWLSLLWIAAWLALLGPLRRRYVQLFREGLPTAPKTRPADLDLTDSATLEVLVEGLGSSESRRVLHSLELLAAHGRGQLVTPLMLHHPDPAVRRRTLLVLRDAERRDALPLIERLLGDGDPTVRATATQVLADLAAEDARALMRERLRDGDVRVRAAALAYLASQPDPLSRQLADSALREMLGDGNSGIRQAAADALGSLDDPHVQAGLVQLLYDAEPTVVLAAIDAVSKRVERGARNPLYVPILTSHLHQRQLKHSSRAALVAYGPTILPALEHFLNDSHEEIWVRRALPKTVAQIGGAAAADTLCRSFSATDPFLRRKLIEALGALPKGELGQPDELLEMQLKIEARSYLRRLLDLESISGSELPLNGPVVTWPRTSDSAGPHLLERLLADRMNDHFDNLFGLLALLGDPKDIRAAHQALVCAQPRLRCHALEYLDNTLRGAARLQVLTVIDDLPRHERHRRAEREFSLRAESLRKTLERLVWQRPVGDADAAWWSAAALHFIVDRQHESLFELIHRAAEGEPDPMVRETTDLLLQRIASR